MLHSSWSQLWIAEASLFALRPRQTLNRFILCKNWVRAFAYVCAVYPCVCVCACMCIYSPRLWNCIFSDCLFAKPLMKVTRPRTGTLPLKCWAVFAFLFSASFVICPCVGLASVCTYMHHSYIFSLVHLPSVSFYAVFLYFNWFEGLWKHHLPSPTSVSVWIKKERIKYSW